MLILSRWPQYLIPNVDTIEMAAIFDIELVVETWQWAINK